MAAHWTYDPEGLASVTAGYSTGSTVGNRNFVRLLIQDTQTARQLFMDEEIDFVQTKEANAYMVAAALCETLVTRAGGVKFKKIGDFSIQYDVAFYNDLSIRLRARGRSYELPYAAGISISDKTAVAADTDRVKPKIFVNLGNNVEAIAPTTTIDDQ